MNGVATDDFVIDAGGVDEALVVCGCQEGIGEVAEEGFQEAGDGVDVVGEGGRVAEIDSRGVCWVVSAVCIGKTTSRRTNHGQTVL